MSASILERATEAGRVAHANGLPAAPILDPVAVELVSRCHNCADRNDVRAAWLAGWHAANLHEVMS